MGFAVFEILAATSCLFAIVYYYLTRNFDYWKKRGVAGPKPIAFFGNFKDVILGKVNEAIYLKNVYDAYKNEALIGVYLRNHPRLIVRDPEFIKDILIRDFNHFPDRSLCKIHEKANPLYANLLNLEYKRWRPLRTKLSPIFTSGKLKDMFYLITQVAEKYQKYTEQLVDEDKVIECRELTAKFTTDVIGVCVFGLNMNAVNHEESEFRKFGKYILNFNFRNRLKIGLRLFFPEIYDVIGHLLETDSDSRFFIQSMMKTIKHRKDNNFRRNDILDLLMDIKDNALKMKDLDITDNLLIAQTFIFFIAGFETSSTTISNALYELALNPTIQDQLRKEISDELANNNGKFTYDCIKNMSYLDKVIKETLRKYPVGAVLYRKAASAHTFAGTKVTIAKGTRVTIPVLAIHRDPDIYPNPEVYDPERFSEDNEKARHPMNYLPFGDGPHNCIGYRFAKFQTKIGVAAIVAKFKLEVCDKTLKEYRVEPRAIVPVPMGGLYLSLSQL